MEVSAEMLNPVEGWANGGLGEVTEPQLPRFRGSAAPAEGLLLTLPTGWIARVRRKSV